MRAFWNAGWQKCRRNSVISDPKRQFTVFDQSPLLERYDSAGRLIQQSHTEKVRPILFWADKQTDEIWLIKFMKELIQLLSARSHDAGFWKNHKSREKSHAFSSLPTILAPLSSTRKIWKDSSNERVDRKREKKRWIQTQIIQVLLLDFF